MKTLNGHILPAIFLLLFLQGVTQGSDIKPPVFEAIKDTIREGYVKISWKVPKDTSGNFIIQQSNDPTFKGEIKTVYEGSDMATFVSGLPDGVYFYRVKHIIHEKESKWSETLEVRVVHRSLVLAFSLFGLGAVVVLLTAGIIILGNRRYNT